MNKFIYFALFAVLLVTRTQCRPQNIDESEEDDDSEEHMYTEEDMYAILNETKISDPRHHPQVQPPPPPPRPPTPFLEPETKPAKLPQVEPQPPQLQPETKPADLPQVEPKPPQLVPETKPANLPAFKLPPLPVVPIAPEPEVLQIMTIPGTVNAQEIETLPAVLPENEESPQTDA